jgi:hypothetical protein
MSTVQQILDDVQFEMPHSNTDARMIRELSKVHDNVFIRLNRLKNETIPYTDITIADQLTYNLPSNCRIDNIALMKIGDTVTVSANTIWYEVPYIGLLDDNSDGYYHTKIANNKYALTLDGKAITTAGLPIRIFYYKTPAALTLVTETPELDEIYHELLVHELAHVVARAGHNPDDDKANFHKAVADEMYAAIEENYRKQEDNAPDVMRVVQGEW